MRGISRKYLQSYLDEHCWRQLFKDEFQVFERMLSEIANQFPPGSIDYILDDIASLTIDDSTKVYGLFDVIDLNDENEEVVHLPDYAEEEFNGISAESENVVHNAECAEVEELIKKLDGIKEIEDGTSTVVITEKLIEEPGGIEETENATNEELINRTLEKFKNKELQIFSFPSSLTIKERERIHEFATNINLHHLTTGTRYHKLTISVNPIEKKEENTRQKIASQ